MMNKANRMQFINYSILLAKKTIYKMYLKKFYSLDLENQEISKI